MWFHRINTLLPNNRNKLHPSYEKLWVYPVGSSLEKSSDEVNGKRRYNDRNNTG